jgi:hypothetical protein
MTTQGSALPEYYKKWPSSGVKTVLPHILLSFSTLIVIYLFFDFIRLASLAEASSLLRLFSMYFKSSFLCLAILAFSAVEVAAHAAINPALGVQGKAVRNDVQRPSTAKPCGNAALSKIDTSTAVTADASGSFTMTIQNFNGYVMVSAAADVLC